MKFLNSQKGDSLITVLVAAAIGSIILVAGMKMIDNLLQGQKALSARADAEDLATEVKIGISGNQNSCALNMSSVAITTPPTGAAPLTFPVPSFSYTNVDGTALGDQIVSNGGNFRTIRVSSMNLVVTQQLSPTSYAANLRIGVEGRTGNVPSMLRSIPLSLTVDAAGTITTCRITGEGGGGPTGVGTCPARTGHCHNPNYGYAPNHPADTLGEGLLMQNGTLEDCPCECVYADASGNANWRCTPPPQVWPPPVPMPTDGF